MSDEPFDIRALGFDPAELSPAMRYGLYIQLMADSVAPLSCPQPAYIGMQQTQPGGLLCPMEGLAVSFGREVTDYVLRNHELFSSAVEMPLGNVRPLIPLNIDPPKHATYRKILDPLFAPRRMDAIEPDVKRLANHFIDGFIDRGECNFTDEFAELFPSAIFLDLMGLPWDELHNFLDLRDGILHPQKFDPAAATDPAARAAVVNEWGQRIYAYFDAALDARVANPTNDILTHFITAEVDGDRMTRHEILDLCFLFLIAGLDTVSDSLTCMWAFLANSPDHRRQIVDDPAIIPNAVEEMLRYESPVPNGVPRVATRDVVLPNGTEVSTGTVLLVNYGGANVDPTEFPDGMEVRFDRDENRHIAFGGGVHRCLGSHLARRELRVALAEWHRRIPEYRIKPGHEELQFPPGLRHVKDLMLVW